jgi:hypothetical protein
VVAKIVIRRLQMSKELNAAVESLMVELERANLKVIEIKKTINGIRTMMGEPLQFSDQETVSAISGNVSIRPDQFFGKGLATAVKEYLKMRGQAVNAQEILDALKAGGFEFPSEWREKYMLRNLTISMSKNRNDFVYVKSSNAYGLWEFYPEKKKEREKTLKADSKAIPDLPITPEDEEKQDGQSTNASQ